MDVLSIPERVIKQLKYLDYPTSYKYDKSYLWMEDVTRSWSHAVEDLLLCYRCRPQENRLHYKFLKVHHIENSLLNFNSLNDLCLQMVREKFAPTENRSGKEITKMEKNTNIETVRSLLRKYKQNLVIKVIDFHANSDEFQQLRSLANMKKHRWNISFSDEGLTLLQSNLKQTNLETNFQDFVSILINYNNFFVDYFVVLLVALGMSGFRKNHPKPIGNDSKWHSIYDKLHWNKNVK